MSNDKFRRIAAIAALICMAACKGNTVSTPATPTPSNPTPTPQPTTTVCQRTVSVSGQTAWQDTGCDVATGDRISISASGSIRFDSSGSTASPNGSGRGSATAGSGGCNFLLCGASIPQHSLVGRSGSSSLQDFTTGFFAGSSFATTSGSSGRLYLGFNDGFVRPDRSGLDSGGVGDNSGSFSATITISR